MSKLKYLALFTALAATGPASASLLGQSVTGSLEFPPDSSNYFDPANGLVPPTGYLNSTIPDGTSTVTIQNSAIEFGADDTFATYSADFTDTTLIVSELISQEFIGFPFTMTFTLAPDRFSSVNKISDNFLDGGLTASLDSAGVLTITWLDGSGVTLESSEIPFTATFSIESESPSQSVPEPSILALMSLGLAGIGVVKRRRVPAASA